MNNIEIKNISKHFGKLCSLDDISFQIEENKIYGLLGRNGAGKSTLFNIISNRIFATSGKVLIDARLIGLSTFPYLSGLFVMAFLLDLF